MNDRPWWANALQWAAWGVLMMVIMGWLARSRSQDSTREGVLAQPRSVAIIGWACTGFFAAIAVLSIRFSGDDPSVWPAVVFGLFVVMGLYVVADYYRARHELRDDGLRYGRTLGPGGLARWDEIERVAFSDSAKWFRLHLTDGRVVRLSAMLQGLPEFAAQVLERVPGSVIDTKTRQLLEETAAGHPPSVWQ